MVSIPAYWSHSFSEKQVSQHHGDALRAKSSRYIVLYWAALGHYRWRITQCRAERSYMSSFRGKLRPMENQEKVVLVVEDDAETILLLRLMFRQHGIKIVAKPNGEESLAAANTLKPDLVLLDIMMPGMDGWEIYQRMKASSKLQEIPIIVVTARPKSIARMHGQYFDAVDGYVAKPFDPRSLVALVESCLASPPTSVELPTERSSSQ